MWFGRSGTRAPGLNTRSFHEDVDIVLKFTHRGVFEGILTHRQEWRGIEVKRDQIGAVALKVGKAVNVEVLCGTHKPLRQFASAHFKKTALLSHFKNGLGGFTCNDPHRAGGTAMIVDRTRLSVSPAKNQRVVSRPRMHEVALITLVREMGEGLDFR